MTDAPKRIQRRRTKGWRLPKGAIYVGRRGKFGNHWTPEMYWDAGYSGPLPVALQHCVDAFRAWMTGGAHWAHAAPLPDVPDITPLRGKDLACWCPLGSPCHADVLLELANTPTTQEVSDA